MPLNLDWWWSIQAEIELEFNFSRIREDVATQLSSRYFTCSKNLATHIEGKDIVLVGAGITSSVQIPDGTLLVADGAVKACFERNIIPDLIITDMDGYPSDIKWACDHGSEVIIHVHGDNITRIPVYSSFIHPISVTSAYPSLFTSCWGGFTDGDRAVMMCLAHNCNSIKLIGFDFEKVGQYSGDYSLHKIAKLKWANRIINECMKKSQKISFI